MRNLFAKELRLSIHPFFYFLPFLTGSLLLLPQWVFLVALMYFFFISIPNIHSAYNAQNDNGFTAMMPVRKKDIVRARIAAISFLELLHIGTAVLFAVLNRVLYGQANFAMDLNMAFFGVSFAMYGLFNLVFFPIYYRTAWKYGKASILGIVTVIMFAAAAEFTIVFSPVVARLLEGSGPAERTVQAVVLTGGIILSVLMTMLAARISARRFEAADL